MGGERASFNEPLDPTLPETKSTPGLQLYKAESISLLQLRRLLKGCICKEFISQSSQNTSLGDWGSKTRKRRYITEQVTAKGQLELRPIQALWETTLQGHPAQGARELRCWPTSLPLAVSGCSLEGHGTLHCWPTMRMGKAGPLGSHRGWWWAVKTSALHQGDMGRILLFYFRSLWHMVREKQVKLGFLPLTKENHPD